MHRKPNSPRKAKGIVAKIRARMFAADPLCYYCRCLTQLPSAGEHHSHTATLDHKTPISRGGRKASAANLALCCYSCNQAKADQTEAEFRAAHPTPTDENGVSQDLCSVASPNCEAKSQRLTVRVGRSV